MRVISGQFRGRTLRSPGNRAFRPTTDRVKEALFNILANTVDWGATTCCDLFAGSGSLGIEALSRGAKHVTFVEKDRSSLEVLEGNLTLLPSRNYAIIPLAVETYLEQVSDRFDLMLADPPYEYARYNHFLRLIAGRDVLHHGGFLLIEHAGKTVLSHSHEWHVMLQRTYGTTAITLLRLNGMETQ